MSIRKAFALFAGALAFASAAAFGQMREYAAISPPQPTEGGGKVEVVEFFWYGCGHCYRLEPFIEKWAANLPKDVVFRRIPAVASDSWAQSALMFYTFEAMGNLDKLHRKVFDAIHQENLNLTVKKVREDWLVKQGVDVAKYNEVEKSFSVVSKMNRAKQMTGAYKVDGVPMIYVNGKYVTSNTHTRGDISRVMVVVDDLIKISRQETK
jgi:thiol:disulfide interchange protein DsbA